MSDYYKSLRNKVGHELLMMPSVAAVIHDEGGDVLMMRHRADGLWSLPAGAVEPGETPAQAVVREVTEETGLEVTPRTVLGVFGGPNYRVTYPNGDRVEYSVSVYACDIVAGELEAVDGEALEFGWFDPADPPQMGMQYPTGVLAGLRHLAQTRPASLSTNWEIELVRGTDHVEACEDILRRLPDWFGIEEAIVEYVEQVAELPTFVAQDAAQTIGFLSVERHSDVAAEIHVMGVAPSHHRRGVGRALVNAAESYLRDQGVRFLQVKTLSDSSDSSEYARTRRFYWAMGFEPLQEFATLWGESNPCMQMIKVLV